MTKDRCYYSCHCCYFSTLSLVFKTQACLSAYRLHTPRAPSDLRAFAPATLLLGNLLPPPQSLWHDWFFVCHLNMSTQMPLLREVSLTARSEGTPRQVLPIQCPFQFFTHSPSSEIVLFIYSPPAPTVCECPEGRDPTFFSHCCLTTTRHIVGAQ